MGAKELRALGIVCLLVFCLSSLIGVCAASPDIRPGSQLNGIIVAPKEERKLALSKGDEIFVATEKSLPVKKGDVLEIFQPISLSAGEEKVPWFAKAGEIVILEIINDRFFLGVIDSSTKEITVGDRLYFPEK
jgi:hypothetical protein